MDPKQLPSDKSDLTELDLALYMLQNDIGMVVIQYDEKGEVVSYEERSVSEDEDE